MTHERPYKQANNTVEALDEIKRYKGTQYDPYLADIFIKIVEEEMTA